jgi:hypothetical protein
METQNGNDICQKVTSFKHADGPGDSGSEKISLDQATKWAASARANSKKIAEQSKELQKTLKKTLQSGDELDLDKYFVKSKCYFIGFDVITKFFGIPGIDGLRIYKGLDENDNERLILVAATNYEGQSYDVFQYYYSFHDEWVDVGSKSDPIDASIYALTPCPPPYPCPKTNKLNSSSGIIV